MDYITRNSRHAKGNCHIRIWLNYCLRHIQGEYEYVFISLAGVHHSAHDFGLVDLVYDCKSVAAVWNAYPNAWMVICVAAWPFCSNLLPDRNTSCMGPSGIQGYSDELCI